MLKFMRITGGVWNCLEQGYIFELAVKTKKEKKPRRYWKSSAVWTLEPSVVASAIWVIIWHWGVYLKRNKQTPYKDNKKPQDMLPSLLLEFSPPPNQTNKKLLVAIEVFVVNEVSSEYQKVTAGCHLWCWKVASAGTVQVPQKLFCAVISFLGVEAWNGGNISHYK